MPEPVFGGDDRVDNSGYPAELQSQLQGKPVTEHAKIITKFYSERETALVSEANRRINLAKQTAPSERTDTPPTTTRSNLPATLTKEQVWNDPVKVLNDMKQGLITKEEFDQQTASAQKTIIQMAEQIARTNKDAEGQRLWQKYKTEIDAIMANLPPSQRADSDYWDTAYNAVMGRHVSEIRSEAVTKATTIAEPGQNASEEPAPPEDLSQLRAGSKTALDVCAGLGITQDSYRKSKKEMNTGTLGLTLTNTGR